MHKFLLALCFLIAQSAYTQCYKISGRVVQSNNQQLVISSNGNRYGLIFDDTSPGIRYARGLRISSRVFFDKKSNKYITKNILIDLPLRSMASKVSSVELVKGLDDLKSCLQVPK